jgi:hypothetical protein
MGRATELRFKGKRNQHGEPVAFLAAIPARDLDAQETAALSDGQYEEAIGSGLYEPASPAPQVSRPAAAESGKEG